MNPAAKDVTTYSPEELRAFRERFAPLASQFRSQLRKASWYAGAAVLLVIVQMLVRPHSALVFLVLWLATLALFVQAVRTALPLPTCPACNAGLGSVRGAFCPDCGAAALSRRVWYWWRRCGACRVTLSRGKGGRRYRIRACNQCGVMLDERGL